MNKKLFRNLEIAGGFVIFAVASFLHFLYGLTNRSVLGALFGAVNESVWEHLKIFILAYGFWAFIEFIWVKPDAKQFLVAKTVSVYLLCIAISGFFYLYTAILGKSLFPVDISIAFLFTLGAQYLSHRLVTSDLKLEIYFYTAIMFLVLLLTAVLCFSYYPPKVFFFRDPVTGGFGTEEIAEVSLIEV